MIAAANPLTELGEAISAERLKSDGFSDIRRVFFVPRTDSTGDNSIFIYVLLSNRLKEDDLTWAKLEPLVKVVRERAMAHLPAEIFPYIHVLKEGNAPKGFQA